jgi:hypothetical protein
MFPDGLPSLALSKVVPTLIPVADPKVGAPKNIPEMVRLYIPAEIFDVTGITSRPDWSRAAKLLIFNEEINT